MNVSKPTTIQELASALEQSSDGDTVIVWSDNAKELAERAAKRMRKDVIIKVEPFEY